ncbi:hypothetical protein D9M71_681300 [compost metagenome]
MVVSSSITQGPCTVCPGSRRLPLNTAVDCQSPSALKSIGRRLSGTAAGGLAGPCSSGCGGRGRWPITEHSRFTSSTGLSGSA